MRGGGRGEMVDAMLSSIRKTSNEIKADMKRFRDVLELFFLLHPLNID